MIFYKCLCSCSSQSWPVLSFVNPTLTSCNIKVHMLAFRRAHPVHSPAYTSRCRRRPPSGPPGLPHIRAVYPHPKCYCTYNDSGVAGGGGGGGAQGAGAPPSVLDTRDHVHYTDPPPKNSEIRATHSRIYK